MSPENKSASDLAAEDWLPYEELIDRFEQAWEQGARPALDDYLPAGEARCRAALIELVHTDLEYRLKAGEAARVEEYWQRYPDLARDRGSALELIAAEYGLRRRREPHVGQDEYLARFPQYALELWSVWETEPGEAEDARPGEMPCLASSRCRKGLDGPSPEAPAGTLRLGKYELQAVLGRGTFGVVFRARDRELGRTVAVKVPQPGSFGVPEEADRFLREARSAAQLQHPHIVTLLEAEQAAGTCYLVYEFVPGATLAQQLGTGRPQPRQAAELVVRVATPCTTPTSAAWSTATLSLPTSWWTPRASPT